MVKGWEENLDSNIFTLKLKIFQQSDAPNFLSEIYEQETRGFLLKSNNKKILL